MSNSILYTGADGFTIRWAEEKDCADILRLVKLLAKHEGLDEKVEATEESLRESIFKLKQAEVIIGELHGKTIGHAVFFTNFSTYVGKGNIYLEDIYVMEEYRGRGYGVLLLKTLAKIAKDRKCKRIDWTCVHWNVKAIDFYKQIGAHKKDDTVHFRLEGHHITNFAKI